MSTVNLRLKSDKKTWNFFYLGVSLLLTEISKIRYWFKNPGSGSMDLDPYWVWIQIQIKIDEKSWIQIKMNTNPKHWLRLRLKQGGSILKCKKGSPYGSSVSNYMVARFVLFLKNCTPLSAGSGFSVKKNPAAIISWILFQIWIRIHRQKTWIRIRIKRMRTHITIFYAVQQEVSIL